MQLSPTKLHTALVEERNVLHERLQEELAAIERWKEYEIEVEAIIDAFVVWGGPDLANEMSPTAERVRGLLAARPDRGTNYRRLPEPTL